MPMSSAAPSDTGLNLASLVTRIKARWTDDALPHLFDYVAIPAKSQAFDADWEANGHMRRAAEHLLTWASRTIAPIEGACAELVALSGRTPTLVVEIPGEGEQPVLLYGHYDKQPEMTGWAPGTGPWSPVLRNGRLYGRGGADDGYAIYAALIALVSLAEEGRPFPRCIVLIEGSEESGSDDLPFYLETLAPRIGRPPLVVCLDSGCGNYDQLWVTTSLRGLAGGILGVQVLTEGIHSGAGTGIVPSSFRIARQLISRIEDEKTGRVFAPEFQAPPPSARIAEARAAGGALGQSMVAAIPFAGGTQPISADSGDLMLARSWLAGLEVTGADGLPPGSMAGNVLRPRTALKLSLRLPPTLSAERASAALREILERDPPYGATVTFTPGPYGDGWNAPAFAPWLSEALERASTAVFGRSFAAAGEGGSIPIMALLGTSFPDAQFMITGVLGPHSNAHGPNEFLDIRTAQNVTCCVALVLSDLARRCQEDRA